MPVEDPTLDELTQEEAASLSKLINPDKPGSEQYTWDRDFQRQILSLVCNDRTFAISCRGLLKPSYFQDDCHRRVAGIVFAHFEKYKVLPNQIQIAQELREQLSGKDEESRARSLGELAMLLDFFNPGIESRESYQDKILYFAKAMGIKEAYGKTLEQIKKAPNDPETWVKVAEILKEAMLIERDFDMGLDYFQTVEERYDRKKAIQVNDDKFTTGFAAIDTAFKNGGLLRGEVGSWMGLSGTGKSLCLVTAAIENIHRGKRVLYVSLEINQDAVADRFDSQFTDTERRQGVTINNLFEKRDIVQEALRDFIKDKHDGRLMVIKQFPPANLDISALRAYYAQICLHGFKPDLVIIDYIGEMKDYPGVKTHESRYMIVRDLRGFAVEEQVCVLTAMQPNKSGKEAVRTGMLMDEENLGDSFSQIKPLDAFWTINQLQDERECGLGRVYVAKTRDGKSRFAFHIQFDYDTLSIKQVSQSVYDAKLRKHRAEREETTMEHSRNELEAQRVVEQGKKKQQEKKEQKEQKSKPAVKFNDPGDAMELEEVATPEAEAAIIAATQG